MKKTNLFQASLPGGRPTTSRAAYVACASLAAAAIALTSTAIAQSSGSKAKQKPLGSAITVAKPGLDGKAVQVMVEMTAPSASIAYASALKEAQGNAQANMPRPPLATAAGPVTVPRVQISEAAANIVKSQVQQIDTAQRGLLPALSNLGAKILYRTQRSYNGIVVRVSRDKIAELRKLPGVKAVHAMIPQRANAFSNIDFIGARAFWTRAVGQGTGLHGENIKAADIDSGLDYVHVNFGGPGTQAAYNQVTDTGSNPYFPSAKVPGGYDFAGDAYNASDPDNDTPNPDPNPFDTGGHGTGTASIIGGFGVNFGGTTYTGQYDAGTPIKSMKISPGVAPEAELYPLRVFGTSGSTNLVVQALEWTVDPNGDGDFSDRMDVVNLSLGSNVGFADDPSAVAAAQTAAAGVLVCSAAGNAGDTYYNVSSPAVANNTLAVAATFNDQAGFVFNAVVTGNEPAEIQGKVTAARFGSGSPHTAVTGDVVYAIPHDGSTAFTNAAEVSGNIALIDRGAVFFQVKVDNAQAAGAIGVIVVNNVPGDPFTMLEDSQVPSVLISLDAGTKLKDAAGFDETTGVSTSTPPVNVTIAPGNGSVERPGLNGDTIPSYSSRGPRSGDSFLKPDISAPAEVVSIAEAGTGDGVSNFNGTSSATPHVAGAMALMRQLHPGWSVEALNALAMNTATRDLFTTAPGSSPAPVQYGLSRIGTGRIDLEDASKANVVAYNDDDDGAISLSFGVVEVPVDGSVTLTKNLRVVNKGSSDVSYTLSRQDVVKCGDARFSTTHPLTFTVPAGGSEIIPVRFEATGNTLRHTRDKSANAFQNDLPRQWLSEKGSYAVLTPDSGSSEPVIRVSLYAAVKPVAAMHSTTLAVTPTADSGSFTLHLSGSPILTGGTAAKGEIISLVKPFELQYASTDTTPTSNPTTDPNVLKFIGVTSDYSQNRNNATIAFGLDGFGDFSTPFFYGSDREVYIDVNNDFAPDYVLYLDSYGRAAGLGIDNVYFTVLIDLNTGGGLFEYPTNGLYSIERDTNAFNNSATVMHVYAPDLGLLGQDGPTSFNYVVETYDADNNVVDSQGWFTYDMANPGVNVNGALLAGEPSYLADRPSTAIPVTYDGAAYKSQAAKGVLLLHMHNGKGLRSEAVRLIKPTISSFTPSSGPVGTKVIITGSSFGPGTRVYFAGANNTLIEAEVSVTSDRTLVAVVPEGAQTGKITVANAAGSSVSNTNFTVTPSP